MLDGRRISMVWTATLCVLHHSVRLRLCILLRCCSRKVGRHLTIRMCDCRQGDGVDGRPFG